MRYAALARTGLLLVALSAALVPVAAIAQGDLLSNLADPQSFVARRSSSANEDLNKNGDAKSVAKGETLVLADLEGPGEITHIWCTLGAHDPFAPRSLVVRMYWDGAEKPSVEAPLGDFFGVGHGAMVDFTSLPVAVGSHGRARNCYWKMPFRKSARITLTNESEEWDLDSFYYYVDWRKVESIADDAPYFHARYRQATPAQPGDYTILDTTGKGHYVGTVYSVMQMENGWFGEGDDRFFVDGEEYPSLSGTGTEDYFNDAWGFRQFSTPFYGVSLWDGYFVGDRVTAYRWHVPDPVSFNTSLKVTIEHRGSIFTDQMGEMGGFIERADWISSVAFWYQNPPTAATEPWTTAKDRIPPYRLIKADTMPFRASPSMLVLRNEGNVIYTPSTDDGAIEFDFEVEQDGHYRIDAFMVHALIGGIYQALLDGEPIGGPRDFCSVGMDILPVKLDVHVLKPGKHTLRFEGRGRSPNARVMARPLGKYPNGLGLYYLLLLRLEDMPGFQESLKKALETGKPKGLF